MDRPNALRVPFIDALDAQPDGWDPHAVWRDRVHVSRTPAKRVAKSPALAVLLDASAGWDPLETWRVRVRGSRRATT